MDAKGFHIRDKIDLTQTLIDKQLPLAKCWHPFRQRYLFWDAPVDWQIVGQRSTMVGNAGAVPFGGEGKLKMQATIDVPTSAPAVNEEEAERAANAYLASVLEPEYAATDGFYGNGRWYFLIRCQRADPACTYGVGKIAVDANTGAVIALTDEQIRDAREASIAGTMLARGILARDERGTVLRYQRKNTKNDNYD